MVLLQLRTSHGVANDTIGIMPTIKQLLIPGHNNMRRLVSMAIIPGQSACPIGTALYVLPRMVDYEKRYRGMHGTY